MGLVLALLTTCVAFSLIWALATIVLAWENHRYCVRKIATGPVRRPREHRTLLVVPVKGRGETDLESNLAAFFEQRHPDYELRFVVEEPKDPAWPLIQRLKQRHPQVDCRTIVAGLATGDGQKVHNLLSATEWIDPCVRLIAFADADIRPEPDWLQTLCHNVIKEKRRWANTGYRWMVPRRLTPGNLLTYSINCTLAGLMGAGGHYQLWGGSWVMRRNRFDQLGIRDAWRGTLSDDLVATRTIHRQGGKIAFEPRCLCLSPVDLSLPAALEFLRRQYIIGRKYAVELYYGTLTMTAINVSAWWYLTATAFCGSGSNATFAGLALLLIYFAGIFKGILRQSVLFRRDRSAFLQYRTAALFDILAWPVVASCNLAILASAMLTNTICWRGNRYRIGAKGQIQLLERDRIAVHSPIDNRRRRRAA